MTDIEDFLLARIAEDEAAIERHAVAIDLAFGLGDGGLRRRLSAECTAKRMLVQMYREHDHSAHPDHNWTGFAGGFATATDHALGILALSYAYHPDYDPGWRL